MLSQIPSRDPWQTRESHFCRRHLRAVHGISDHFAPHLSMFETVARSHRWVQWIPCP
jgi:hypothetical protein